MTNLIQKILKQSYMKNGRKMDILSQVWIKLKKVIAL